MTDEEARKIIEEMLKISYEFTTNILTREDLDITPEVLQILAEYESYISYLEQTCLRLAGSKTN